MREGSKSRLLAANDRALRVVFMSSSPFGVPALQALLADSRFQVVGVVTAPDKPAGRGRTVVPSEVKRAAEVAGVPLLQPDRLRSPEAIEQVRALQPDLIVVAAYGQWIPNEVIEMPPMGSINIHPSLLPRHRGAAPAMSAILAGDRVTGVTIILVAEKVDAGDILAQASLPVEPGDTTASLMERLAPLGARLLMETLPLYLEGRIVPQPQDERDATWFGRITKEAGRIDWTEPAWLIERRIRAYIPWPKAFTAFQGTPLRVLAGRVIEWTGGESPGTVVSTPEGPAVVTGAGALVLLRVQPAGRKEMSGAEFARGQRTLIGSRLGAQAG
jgi:methionyl-tRNA formyltransferase